MSDKLYDFEEIRKFVGEDKAALKQMLGIFSDSTPKTLALLNSNFQNKDLDQTAYYAHKLKSSIDLLNIGDLKSEIRLIENLAKNKEETNKIQDLIEKVNQVIPEVLSKLEAEIEQM